MNSFDQSSVAFFLSLALGACSSMPSRISLLNQTRIKYRVAKSNPVVTQYADLEMKQAAEALAQASACADKADAADKIESLLCLAKQKIALAQEVAAQRSVQAHVAPQQESAG